MGFWVVRATATLWWATGAGVEPSNLAYYVGPPVALGQDGKSFLDPDAKPFETRKDARVWVEACQTYGHRSEVRSTEWVRTKLVGDTLASS